MLSLQRYHVKSKLKTEAWRAQITALAIQQAIDLHIIYYAFTTKLLKHYELYQAGTLHVKDE